MADAAAADAAAAAGATAIATRAAPNDLAPPLRRAAQSAAEQRGDNGALWLANLNCLHRRTNTGPVAAFNALAWLLLRLLLLLLLLPM